MPATVKMKAGLEVVVTASEHVQVSALDAMYAVAPAHGLVIVYVAAAFAVAVASTGGILGSAQRAEHPQGMLRRLCDRWDRRM